MSLVLALLATTAARASDSHGDSHDSHDDDSKSEHGDASADAQHTSTPAHASPPPAPKPAKKTSSSSSKSTSKSASSSSGHASGEVHWSYDGDTGPSHWGELGPAFATCSEGHAQTPIDVNTRYADVIGLDDVTLHYHATEGKLLDNGHTIQVGFPEGNAIEVDGEYFALAQFHFHAASEHKLNGQAFPMELHLVHKSAEGELAVLGVFLTPGEENEALAPVFDAMGAKRAKDQVLKGELDPAAFLPEDREVVRYSGSLTTPPCTEGVRWVVFTHPIEVSEEQIGQFTALYDHNARPIQAVNGRTVLLDATP